MHLGGAAPLQAASAASADAMPLLPATRLRATAGRGAHTRRDGARGAVRPVALSPVTAAMVHTHTRAAQAGLLGAIFQVGPPARGARGRGRATARGERETVRAMCAMCHLNAGSCDIHIAYGRYPGRSRWVCPDDMDIGAAIIAAITDIVGHGTLPDGGRAPAAARGPRNGRRGAR